jgi:predicted  nucleic acid-binding Zn ribbon protein
MNLVTLPKYMQEKFVCPQCKKEWELKLFEDDKKIVPQQLETYFHFPDKRTKI